MMRPHLVPAPRRVVSVAALLAVASMSAGCGSDDDAAPSGPTSLAPEASPESSGPRATYVVQSGDAVFAIAQRHCIGADELAAVNDWADGIDHPILPGNVVVLPADACQPAPETVAAAATTRPATGADTEAESDADADSGGVTAIDADARYVELAAAGTIYDPYYGDAFGYWGFVEPECNTAMATLETFARSADPDPASVIDAIDAIDPDALRESDLGVQLDAWAEFSDRYHDLITQTYEPAIHDPGDSGRLETVLTDPDVVEMLDAYTAIEFEPYQLRGAIDVLCTYDDPAVPSDSSPA